MARSRSRAGKSAKRTASTLRELSESLVTEIEGALAFGNVKRISALATTLRVILPLAAKLPLADVAGNVCSICKSPLRITDADIELIENFIQRQKATGAFVSDHQQTAETSDEAGTSPPLG